MPASDSASSRRSDLGSDGERSFGPSSTSGDGWTTRGFTILDPEKGFRGPSMKGVSPHHRSSGLDRRITQMGSGAYQISADVGRRPLDRRREGETALGRRCAVFGAHLGKRCASSKESSRFSKMRTFRKGVRIFEGCAHLRTKRTREQTGAESRRTASLYLCVLTDLLFCSATSGHCLGRRRRSVDCANDADLNLIGDICVICG